MIGMMMFSTIDLMTLPNAAPRMTPTARSIMLPLKAKFLNSSHMPRPGILAAMLALPMVKVLTADARFEMEETRGQGDTGTRGKNARTLIALSPCPLVPLSLFSSLLPWHRWHVDAG